MLIRKPRRAATSERVWNRNLTLWQAAVATLALLTTLLVPFLGGLLNISFQLHDLNAKMASFDKLQDRVMNLESWRFTHSEENRTNVDNIKRLERNVESTNQDVKKLESDVSGLMAHDADRH